MLILTRGLSLESTVISLHSRWETSRLIHFQFHSSSTVVTPSRFYNHYDWRVLIWCLRRSWYFPPQRLLKQFLQMSFINTLTVFSRNPFFFFKEMVVVFFFRDVERQTGSGKNILSILMVYEKWNWEKWHKALQVNLGRFIKTRATTKTLRNFFQPRSVVWVIME